MCNINWWKYETTCTEGSESEGGEYGCLKTTQKITPLYSTINVLVGYGTSVKKEPVYIKVPTTVVNTYYRQSTRKFIPGTTDTKWDTCENSSLVDKGYVFTGNKKEVK